MTDQSKIPVLPEDEKRGKSLFERAESMFGERAYTPAPVPRELAQPVNRQVAKRKAPRTETPAPETVPQEPTTRPVGPFVDVGATKAMPVPEPVTAAPVDESRSVATDQELPKVAFSAPSAKVDRANLAREGLIDPGGPVTALLEEFRIVKRELLKAARASDDPRARRILVCSPLPGEGKSFCAANLALALAAEKDCEVVLVDADIAKPSILSLFGLPKGPGLMDTLANPSIAIEDCVVPTDIGGLHVLPAGDQTASDSEFLSSRRTAEVLDRLTRNAPKRLVIFDSPPALAASPAADLANHVGQAVVVARADTTGESALEDALSLLSNCPDIKLLLNAANFSPSGRRFGAYYGYGE